MTPAKMLIANGDEGDCFRTCVAVLLDLHPADVPHVMDGVNDEDGAVKAWAAMQDFLHPLGFHITSFYFVDKVDDVFKMMHGNNPDLYYILIGDTTGGNHAVVARGNQIVCDPSWIPAPIIGPADTGFIGVHILVPTKVVRLP